MHSTMAFLQMLVPCCIASSTSQEEEVCSTPQEARIPEASSSTSPQTVDSERLQPYGFNQTVQISSSLFKLHEPAPPHSISIDVIFFHGLQFDHNSDGYLSTWRTGDASQEVWPQTWLPAEYPGARIISVSYDAFIGTNGTQGMTDMYVIGENLLAEILSVRKNRGTECPIVLVGHSFGGLVIKQLCVHASNFKGARANGQDIRKFLDSIRGIFFYATPHQGFNTAVRWKHSVMTSMPPNTALLSFVELFDKDHARLHQVFVDLWSDHKWQIYAAGELHDIIGQSSLLVVEASSRFGNKYISVESDHFSICRPVSKISTGYRHLVNLIDDIYDRKSKDERRNQENAFKNVVGAKSLLPEVQGLLQEYTFLGFCGMGGVGKTTMAKLAFNNLSASFEYTCFVEDVKLIQGNKGEIKKKIWENMRHHDHGHSVPRRVEVRGKKLLVVLDDIDKRVHAELLQEIADDNASRKSRFISTSRDAEVLRLLVGIKIYPVPVLKPEVARELFIAHAFPGQDDPPEDLIHKMEDVVKGCGGLPLTLEVLGKYFRGEENVKIWDEMLVAIGNAEALPLLQESVWGKLQLSYDALGASEKHMFLDIASFLLLESCPFSFKEVRTVWSSMFTSVHIRWKTLVDRSLVQEGIGDSFFDKKLVIGTLRTVSTMEHGGDVRIVKVHEHLRSIGQRIAEESPGRYISMTDSQWGGNPIQSEKVVALRAHFSLHWDADMERSCDTTWSPCGVQQFFLQVEAVPGRRFPGRYLDLAISRSSVSCKRCGTSGGFSLPRGLVMFRWRGFNVHVKLPLEALVCRSLVVLRLDRDDDCSLDILSQQACGYLSSLQRITLKCSELVRLPHAFGSFSRLEHMEIRQCGLLERLPETFGNLGRLKRLRIKWCGRLEGLPETFGNLRSLKHLKIEYCDRLETLSKTFGNLGSLKHLEIVGCGRLEGLSKTFGNLSRLEHLNIQYYGLLQRLPKTFGNLGSLKHLAMKWCDRLEGLSEKFGNLSNLEHLNIERCPLLERLPETFGNLGSVKHLEIEWCEKLEGLPETFGDLSNLEYLEINRCDLLETLSETFGNFGSLKHLVIKWCGKLEGFPETLGSLSSLKHMEIRQCVLLERLPRTFGNLSSLKHLKIEWCRSLKWLPNTFGNLNSLKHLEINRCGVLERLQETFGNLGNLRHLVINWCGGLEGLPETFGKLSRLEHLNIERCGQLKRLPKTFGDLGRLKHLKIEWCGSLERLPKTFGNLSGLEHLEINRCGLLQRLPETFGKLVRLKHLVLKWCGSLEGLPETFGNLSSLERLDIERCGLLERLPETFGNLRSLKHLVIGWCESLEGLPETFGNLSSLGHLEILECGLLERLPETFRNLSSLKHLRIIECERFEGLQETLKTLIQSRKGHIEIRKSF